MATDFSKVSLGFAEFVSQLIHETFDAILDSQNYQLDRYQEFEKALNTSNALFRQNYITDQEFADFQISLLGFVPAPNQQADAATISLLNGLTAAPSADPALAAGKLTLTGVNLLNDHSLNKLVDARKSKLQALLNNPGMARLIVDSGEIKSKLELFCLNETAIATVPVTLREAKVPPQTEPAISKTKFDIAEIKVGGNGMKVRELVDKETQVRTILIDKKSIPKANNTINTISTARLVANPLSASSTTNLYSEVTIKFRTI